MALLRCRQRCVEEPLQVCRNSTDNIEDLEWVG
jgi:hypothetical protein